MPYNDPQQNELQRADIGLDGVLVRIKSSFEQNVSWLYGQIFLRAYENRFKHEVEGVKILPEVYMGEGEYYNALFNDNLAASMFFKTNGSETILFDRARNNRSAVYTRQLSLMFWGDLKRINAPYKSDYIYTEAIKEEFMEVLGQCSDVKSIDSFLDDPIEDVFKGYTLPEKQQLGKYPVVFFKIDFTVQYNRPIKRC